MSAADPLARFRFRYRLEVRFRDLDALGHVNNAVYLTYLESARIAWWMHVTARHDLRALDMILTGRAVGAEEALAMGLANRVVAKGRARQEAVALAHELCRFPQVCMRADRRSAYEQWSLPLDRALRNEFERGLAAIASGETLAGATRFASGHGRSGSFEDI